MKQRDPKLIVQAAPFINPLLSMPQVMRDVVIAVAPVTLASIWFFGLSALLVLLATIAGGIATEWAFSPAQNRGDSLRDNTGVLTCLLLGLTLPPSLPLWMAFIGGGVAIGLGKMVWGGVGQNLFNPALVGRAFLLATFPTAMTTWTPLEGPGGFFNVHMSNFAIPLMQSGIDATTAATPLGLMKFQQESTALTDLMIGTIPGSLGEASGLLIILGGIYLYLRRCLDWRIPIGMLASVVLFSGMLYLVDSTHYPDPLFTLFSGGLLFGAVFMATDPVTSPVAPKGAWIFGIGIGLLVVLIRVFGGFPEGVMYAILLMNAATPLIERYTQPRIFGRGKSKQS
ncbi:MAG: RnfABCDGE type electron transport complex subunit D [Pseudomonadota bacterium]